MTAPHAPFTSPGKGEVDRAAVGRGSSSRFSRTIAMTERARRLRKEPTDVEQKLWRRLRRNQIDGLSFRRQHPAGPYVLDFYCPTLKLAIELDGGQHNFAHQRRKDERRTGWLQANGIRVLRFWNNDLTSNLLGVLEEISRVAAEMTPTPTLPLSGGGSAPSAPRVSRCPAKGKVRTATGRES